MLNFWPSFILGITAFLLGGIYNEWVDKRHKKKQMPFGYACLKPGCTFKIEGNGAGMILKWSEHHHQQHVARGEACICPDHADKIKGAEHLIGCPWPIPMKEEL